MSGPREPSQGNTGLGKKVEPKKTEEKDWMPYKPGFEVNKKGQLRTVPK